MTNKTEMKSFSRTKKGKYKKGGNARPISLALTTNITR